jgi:hypothetical protein
VAISSASGTSSPIYPFMREPRPVLRGMSPHQSSPSVDFGAEELPPLTTTSRPTPDLLFDSDEVEEGSEPRLYCLVLIDEETGAPVRPATDHDLASLVMGDDLSTQTPPAKGEASSQPHPPKQQSFQELLASTYPAKEGPSCMHCGVTGESVGCPCSTACKAATLGACLPLHPLPAPQTVWQAILGGGGVHKP